MFLSLVQYVVVQSFSTKNITQRGGARGNPGKVSVGSGGYSDTAGREQDTKLGAFGRYGIKKRKVKVENTG